MATIVKQLRRQGTPPTGDDHPAHAAAEEPPLPAKMRAQNQVRRVIEAKRVGGFKTLELATLVSALVFPLADTAKDWGFTIWLRRSDGKLECVDTSLEPCVDCFQQSLDVDLLCEGHDFGREECLAQGCCTWEANPAGEVNCWGPGEGVHYCHELTATQHDNIYAGSHGECALCEEWADATECGTTDISSNEACVEERYLYSGSPHDGEENSATWTTCSESGCMNFESDHDLACELCAELGHVCNCQCADHWSFTLKHDRSVENCQRSCFKHLQENTCAMGDDSKTLCDHRAWFVVSLAIQLASGFVCGLELGRTHFHETFGLPRWQAVPLGILVGLPGFTCVAMVAIALYTRNPRQGARDIKKMKVLEFVVETYPQTTFQTYVTIMKGQWQPLLILSIMLGLFSGGSAAFGLESLQRDGKGLRMTAFSRYGIVKVLHNTTLLAMMLFMGSSLMIEFRAYAVIPLIAFVFVLRTLGQAPSERAKRSRADFYKGKACGLALLFGVVGAMSVPFSFYKEDSENGRAVRTAIGLGAVEQSEVDAAWESLGFVDEGGSVYSAQIVVYGIVLLWLLLTTTSWALDPEMGHSTLREKSWAERVAKDSEGLSEWSILQAKAEAVWRWADVFRDGQLEEAEIDRLKEATTCSCDSIYEALRNEDSGLLDQRRFIQLCHEDEEQVAAWFSALKLELVERRMGCVEKVLCGILRSEVTETPGRTSRTTTGGGKRARHVLTATMVVQTASKHITPVPVEARIVTEDQLNARYREQSELQATCGLVFSVIFGIGFFVFILATTMPTMLPGLAAAMGVTFTGCITCCAAPQKIRASAQTTGSCSICGLVLVAIHISMWIVTIRNVSNCGTQHEEWPICRNSASRDALIVVALLQIGAAPHGALIPFVLGTIIASKIEQADKPWWCSATAGMSVLYIVLLAWGVRTYPSHCSRSQQLSVHGRRAADGRPSAQNACSREDRHP